MGFVLLLVFSFCTLVYAREQVKLVKHSITTNWLILFIKPQNRTPKERSLTDEIMVKLSFLYDEFFVISFPLFSFPRLKFILLMNLLCFLSTSSSCFVVAKFNMRLPTIFPPSSFLLPKLEIQILMEKNKKALNIYFSI